MEMLARMDGCVGATVYGIWNIGNIPEL